MIITFDLSGRDRKQLVKAISEITGARAVYKFMPTCAYEIDFFTVTKEGTLEFPDRSDTEIVEQVLDGLAEKGFTMTSAINENGHSDMFGAKETSESEEATDTAILPDTAEITETEEVSEEVETAAETTTLPNTAEVTETEEVSEETETTADTATQPDTAEITETEEVSEETETTADTATQPDTAAKAESDGIDRFSISMRRDFFDEALFAKLDRLIESKSELFKMAFQTDDLSYDITDDRVTFAWFPWTKESGEGIAYSTFIDLLTKHLKEQKRVNASKTQTDNPKFAMRVFLIRLGMVGEEYKAARKILLRNLEGSSTFRKGAKHNDDTE